MLIIASILFTPAHLLAQQPVDLRKDSRVAAVQELEAVITEAKNLDNKNTLVSIKSRAAMLVSFSDPIRSENMFLDVWKFANEQTDKDFDKEQAVVVVLKYLFPRNPKLARRLIAEQAKQDRSMQSRAASRDDELKRAGKLASELMDTDPAAAAAMLEQSLSSAVTPAGVGALSRLRERDPVLSDYLAAKVLEGLSTQPTLMSLPGLHLMGAYIFPGAEAPISSTEAESSLQLLQFKYLLAGYDLLGASLKETDEALLKGQHYTKRDLQFRAAYQGQIAAILAALAPRLQPSLAAELTDIAAKLAPQVPANISQLNKFTLSRISGNQTTSEDPETNFLLAISNGDFDEASKQVDRLKDGEKKDLFAQLLLKTQAKSLLTKSDVVGALTAIRKIEDQTTRLVMYLEALKVANKKRDSAELRIVVNEAQLLIPQVDKNGLHVRALLSFAAQLSDLAANDDAIVFLNTAVTAINALSTTTDEQGTIRTQREIAMAEINDPISLRDAQEMERAFSLVGLVDLDRSLIEARRIELKPIQLLARLETIQGVIRSASLKPKLPTKTHNVSSNPKK
jgi:hypothetical protein